MDSQNVFNEKGLSPRIRGNRSKEDVDAGTIGSIPAHTGKPGRC